MSDDAGAEDRTEEPSARRLAKARAEGEHARSIEVPAAAVLIAGATVLMIWGERMASGLAGLLESAFTFDHALLQRGESLPGIFAREMRLGLGTLVPLFIACALAAILSSGLTGGYLFSLGAAAPKLGKLNLLAGLARMLSLRSLVELGKSLLKVTVVGLATFWSVRNGLPDLINLSAMPLPGALAAAGVALTRATLAVTLSLLLIGVLDAFYQRYSFNKRMRMTKQEVRDELKDAEGSPEIKARIRKRQREIAAVRMLERIKDADVVITNPTHFAVALSYDPTQDGAPTVIAKGVDELAHRLIAEARRQGVATFEAPPLARAVYFTTRIGHPIREELYYAVAQVIAYVMNLESMDPRRGAPQRPLVMVPDSMRFNPDGQAELSAQPA